MAKAYGEARKEHGNSQLLDEIVAAKPERDHTHFHSFEELKAQGLQHLRDSVALLEKKAATPEEVEEYRRFILTLSNKVASAHREHGQDVSESEQKSIRDISDALGVGAWPPPIDDLVEHCDRPQLWAQRQQHPPLSTSGISMGSRAGHNRCGERNPMVFRPWRSQYFPRTVKDLGRLLTQDPPGFSLDIFAVVLVYRPSTLECKLSQNLEVHHRVCATLVRTRRLTAMSAGKSAGQARSEIDTIASDTAASI
jgi:hypothetical protein